MNELTATQGRVLGALVEKALTTPQQYPLTLNALLLACNQTSNREPVVAYDEVTVEQALAELKERRLVRFVLPSHGRSAIRYRHVLDETLGLDAAQLALLAVLVLRGPQTVGELRLRTERMADLGGLGEVERELDLLASHEEELVERLPRGPGQKEERWRQRLVETGWSADGLPDRSEPTARSSGGEPSGLAAAVAALQNDVGELRHDLAEIRQALGELRESLGG